MNAAVQQANIAELLINRASLRGGRPMILEAAQTHRAVGFTDGALFDEIQLGRLLLGEGDLRGRSACSRTSLEEATSLGAARHRPGGRRPPGRLPARRVGAPMRRSPFSWTAEQAAGSEAALFAASVELVRSEALTRLGDADGAARAPSEAVRRGAEDGSPLRARVCCWSWTTTRHRQRAEALLDVARRPPLSPSG